MTNRYRSSLITSIVFLFFLLSLSTTASAADLDITVKDDAANPISDADVTITNDFIEWTETTDFDGHVQFENVNQSVFDVTVSHDGYKQRQLDVDLRNNRTRTIILDEQTLGDLTLHITDEDKYDIGDASVDLSKIDGSTTESGTTDNEGKLVVERLPEGEYEAAITKDTYADTTITIDVTAGDHTFWSTSMTQDGTEAPSDLVIEELSVPSPLRRGDTATITATARNQDNQDIDELNASAYIFDTNQTTTNISIKQNASHTAEFQVTVPDDIEGETPLRLTFSNNFYNATTTTDVTVSSYAGFMEISQEELSLGDTVFINGRITNTETDMAARSMGASLYLDRTLITGVTTDETGRFSTYVRPSTVGTKTVALENRYFDIEKHITVTPSLTVTNLQATPNTIKTGDTSEICGTVTTARERDITLTLTRGGETIHESTRTIDTEATPCFDVGYNNTGMIATSLTVSYRGVSETATTQVNVTDQTAFPLHLSTTDQLDVEPTENTTAWINITNPSETNHTATIDLDTINNSWLDWTNKSVSIDANTTERYNVTINPSRVGEFVIDTTVTAGGENETAIIDLRVFEPVGSVAERYYNAAAERTNAIRERVTDGERPQTTGIGIGIGTLLVILVVIYYRRNRHPPSLEPQNQ